MKPINGHSCPDSVQLMPSVTRVFSKSRDLHVFLQAYERTATTTQPLVAFVSFYRGEVKAFETTPLAISDGLDCQVTVLDPNGQKVAFWRAPVIVVP